eukprot:TRINITY_DN1508_c0_g2_i2.p1 TRINITY_DN1508_c0_g2~~TRINITY_DN1508_c0_g2_i2.p1  ORF type:complete len:147 (-),score=13.52 TRINITY_DN1508_c0_g2_i2:338-778(-)
MARQKVHMRGHEHAADVTAAAGIGTEGHDGVFTIVFGIISLSLSGYGCGRRREGVEQAMSGQRGGPGISHTCEGEEGNYVLCFCRYVKWCLEGGTRVVDARKDMENDNVRKEGGATAVDRGGRGRAWRGRAWWGRAWRGRAWWGKA